MPEPAKTQKAAQKRYVGHFQAALGCISKAFWYVGPSLSGGPERLLATNEDPVQLRRKPSEQSLWLSASQRFAIVEDERHKGEWKARTLAYIYAIHCEPEINEESEILSWHWHPMTTPGRIEPHAHVRLNDLSLGISLSKLHIPTGRVSIEGVVRLLITDLMVEPERNDWADHLEASESRFREYRTWA